jgi:hypothetical protein
MYIGMAALLGLLLFSGAYLMGSSRGEAQGEAAMARVRNARARYDLCLARRDAISRGQDADALADVMHERSRMSLLQEEEQLLQDAKVASQLELTQCNEGAAAARKMRTGTDEGNLTQAQLRVQYQIRTARTDLDAANATRVRERGELLRVIEALNRENAVLRQELKSKLIAEAEAQAKLDAIA